MHAKTKELCVKMAERLEGLKASLAERKARKGKGKVAPSNASVSGSSHPVYQFSWTRAYPSPLPIADQDPYQQSL